MSMIDGLRSLRKERASLERDRVVLTSMTEDAFVADLLIENDTTDIYESVSEDDLDAIIDKIPESDEEDEEVERILKSEEDMDVDDILGVEV